MPFKCSVPGCRSNCKGYAKSSIFQFPRNEILRQTWVKAMQKENFKMYKYSRVCELHFEPSDIVREASAIDSKTGRTLTARLRVPRLKEGAVPTRFMPTAGTSSKPKTGPSRKKGRPKEDAVKGGTENTNGNQVDISVQNVLGTESENVAETSIVIIQDSVKSADESPRPIIEKIHSAEEVVLLSSSLISTISTPSSTNSPLFLKYSSSISNPDSTFVEETLATQFSNEPTRKRKMIYSESDADEPTSNVTQSNLSRPTKPSMPSKRSHKQHSKTGTSKKYAAHSDFRTTNSGVNATRKMFQSLIDGSEKNAEFGCRTSERPGDLFDVFADFIADKLREMEWDDCAYSLRAILDIVFKVSKVQHDNEAESDIFSHSSSSSSSSHEK